MKKALFYITIFALIGYTLLSSVGVQMYIRHCKMETMPAKTVSFFVPSETCCGETSQDKCSLLLAENDTQENQPLNPCCSFEEENLQTDFEIPIAQWDWECQNDTQTIDNQLFVYQYLFEPLSFLPFKLPAPDRAPPLARTGKQILIHQKRINQ